MKTIIMLLLLGTFQGQDGSTHQSAMAVAGHLMQDGTKVPFKDMDDCQGEADRMVAAAKKDKAEVREFGAVCVAVPLSPIGTDI